MLCVLTIREFIYCSLYSWYVVWDYKHYSLLTVLKVYVSIYLTQLRTWCNKILIFVNLVQLQRCLVLSSSHKFCIFCFMDREKSIESKIFNVYTRNEIWIPWSLLKLLCALIISIINIEFVWFLFFTHVLCVF